MTKLEVSPCLFGDFSPRLGESNGLHFPATHGLQLKGLPGPKKENPKHRFFRGYFGLRELTVEPF